MNKERKCEMQLLEEAKLNQAIAENLGKVKTRTHHLKSEWLDSLSSSGFGLNHQKMSNRSQTVTGSLA